MVAGLTPPPNSAATPARHFLWVLSILFPVPLLHQVRPDEGYAAMARAASLAALWAPGAVVAAERRTGRPLVCAVPTSPLNLLLVSETDGRGRHRVVVVPLALENRIGGYRAALAEVTALALAGWADVVPVRLGGVGDFGVPFVNFSAPRAAVTLQPDSLAAAVGVVFRPVSMILCGVPPFLNALIGWVSQSHFPPLIEASIII